MTYLGSSVFESCSNLVSVDCPLLVTPGNGGFRYCENLQNVNLPKATIFNSTFTDCTSLKTIALPSAKTIGGSAFENCTSLEYVDFSGCTAVPKMSNIDAFEGVPTTC